MRLLIEFVIKVVVTGLAGYLAARIFKNFSLPIRGVAFVGAVALLLSLYQSTLAILTAFLTFGLIAVIECIKLRKETSEDASNQ